MARRTSRIFDAHPKNRLRFAAALGAADRRAEWRIAKARKVRKCPACKERFTKSGPHAATVDHIVPVSKGGTDEPSNWQLLCFTCNQTKGNKPEPRP